MQLEKGWNYLQNGSEICGYRVMKYGFHLKITTTYIEDEEGNYEELLNKEDYDSYGEKEVIYKVDSKKMDMSWDKV